jgi:3-methyl-2-oxobutanoate hydroxymethyltransferase
MAAKEQEPAAPVARRVTVHDVAAARAAGRPISMVTAYDWPTGRLADAAGVDCVLVGDSVAMVVAGRNSTIPATLDQMIYHGEIVGRAATRSLVVVDLPFPLQHLGVRTAIEAAARILKETGCQAVKLEGTAGQADVIAGLVGAGIPVMGHVGLRPQAVHQLGGYRMQRDAERLLADAACAHDRDRSWPGLRWSGARDARPHRSVIRSHPPVRQAVHRLPDIDSSGTSCLEE